MENNEKFGRPEKEITQSGTEASEKSGDYILTCNVFANDLDRIRQLLDGAGCKYFVGRSLRNVPDVTQPLFRFELFYDGTYQAAGLIQGLDDLCGPAEIRRLLKPFKGDLLVPMEIDQPCSFWFTEQGLQKFADGIDEISRYMSRIGWEVRCSVLWVHEMNFLYQDEYQIALGPEFIDPDSFVSFSHAADLMDFDDMTTEHFSESYDFSM